MVKFDTYSDLITFEQHLAGVANVIPIILESAGAIAEFAAFSQGDTIKDKLLIFRQDRYADDASFINYGLVKFVQQKSDEEKFVQTYPWLDIPAFPADEAEKANRLIVEDIANDIEKWVRKNTRKTRRFILADPGHIMVLIEDLIRLMLGLTQSEIVDFLRQLGIRLTTKTVGQYLFLLEKLNIVGDQHYGSRFYFSKDIWNAHVDYAFNTNTSSFDRAAFMQGLEQFYKVNKDKRLNASREFFARHGGR